MGELVSSYIFPHPPVIIPEVGKGAEAGAEKTIAAVKAAADRVAMDRPDTIIITTPHGPVFQDFIYVSMEDGLSGNLERFGAGKVRLNYDNHTVLAEKIIQTANAEGLYCGGLEDSIVRKYKLTKELDHGVTVPLYFVAQRCSAFKIVHISIAGLPFESLYRFGMCIAKAVKAVDGRVVFLASGDLSHRLSKDAPYGYSEKGPEFDRMLVESLRKLDVEKLLRTDEGFCESAGECGLRSFLMMFGALDGKALKPEVLSYEGPFGVGYCVARFEVAGEDPQRKVMDGFLEHNRSLLAAIRSAEDGYVRLARNALETYVREGSIIEVPEHLPSELLEHRAGCFVSIKKQGQLRGCIGTVEPTRENIAQEIIYNAISSGTRDPRFASVEPDELEMLEYSVDILMQSEPVSSFEELDTKKYGVIVSRGRRSGLLLPNLEGVDTVEQQVSIALQKAGIKPEEKYSMQRFEVIRHK